MRSSNRKYFASSDFVYIDQQAFTLHFTCVQGARFYAINEIFIRALLFFRKLTTYCIRRSLVCCVVRMCCPAPHLQPLLQSRSPSHAVCPQPTLRLLPSVSCTPDPDIHSGLHYRSEMTRSRRKMCKQTGSIVCKVGAESLGAAAGASTIHAELRRGSCRNSVQPAAGAAAGMLNPQILCCTIVAFLSPKGNVRLQTCHLQLIYLLSIARV